MQSSTNEKIVIESKSSVDKEVSELIKSFNLQRHPEGGYYARSFQAAQEVKSTDQTRYNNENRSAGTAIYFLLERNDFSAWHKLKSDELWHHYKGSAVKIHVINKQGVLTSHLLGDPTMIRGASFQIAITAGNWFAAEVIDKSSYCLVGCTVTPGFDFKDFELADRDFLSIQFPQHKSIITQLTRVSQNTEEADRPTHGTIRARL